MLSEGATKGKKQQSLGSCKPRGVETAVWGGVASSGKEERG